MASAVDCKGEDSAPASLLKSGAPLAFCSVDSPAVTAARRPYNTQAKEVSRYDDDDDYSARDLVTPSIFSQDVLDPLGAPTSMARLLSLMEDVASQIGLSSTAAGAGASRLGRWVAKEDDDAVYLKVPMPGLTKEHVEVRADKNILVIKGEGEKQPWDGDDDDSKVPRYNRRIEVPAADAYKMDKIKAEMKNGVLWVTLLKVKEEERTDVFHVKVE
uniref:23.5kDa heat-shock protein n=1 Tax=Triticum monococcum TaxID=4568 RepID=A5A8U4_TRIMO|nr:23.5kDa heat-shock protein [Triticum monococcum]